MTQENPFIQMRRELHLIPEIGLEEYKTHDYLIAKIKKLPQENLKIKTWETAIVVRVKGSVGEKTIGWRTDIDGLPVIEETDLPFRSIHDGRMHACGHDVHMSIALGLLTYFSSHQTVDDLVFIFQPAEENVSGAKIIYDSGFLNDYMPDEIYALHVKPDLPVGTLGTKVGTLFAGTCAINVEFRGTGGHAAYPHESNDMIVAASQFINQIQTIISRSVNPMEGTVITLGTMHAGTAGNIISGYASLTGTIRTLTSEMSKLTQQRVRDIVKGIELSYNCKIYLDLDQGGYYPVVNNEVETLAFIDYMTKKQGVEYKDMETEMTGEDFGYYLDKIPGTMFWLGVDCPYGLHHPKMTPNEKAIPFAIEHVGDFLEKKANRLL
ncbi:N-acetyldiaminopimelate deacetylase [Carnobacterium alterfunditum]|uniref:N-acetyldiaminopimelate deacetylase n=1 Tax=Carnobacterium alterfunditum TaxID=28230 RepID=UPI0035930887